MLPIIFTFFLLYNQRYIGFIDQFKDSHENGAIDLDWSSNT
jgi:hypothetical protein